MQTATPERIEVRPNPGPQERFLACGDDIALYGGAAGGGKTAAVIMEPLRWVSHPGFRAVFFRRTYPQITEGGGPWDQAAKLYPPLGGKERRMEWVFPSGARVMFRHMQREADRYKYDGASYPVILFDELAHFTSKQFWFLQARNRTTLPIRPYTRMTSNPTDPDHWLYKELVAWWIGPDGFPDPTRAGVARWFVRDDDDELIWADSPDELEPIASKLGRWPQSFSFHPAKVTDNPVLMQSDPGYLAKLQGLQRIERERLLSGNWHVRPVAGSYFRRDWFRVIPDLAVPDLRAVVRYWDRAASVPTENNPDPDRTAGVLMGLTLDGDVVVIHSYTIQASPGEVLEKIRELAEADLRRFGERYSVGLEVDPGAAGKSERLYLARALAGLPIRWARPQASKERRAGPYSAAVEAGQVMVVKGPWLDAYLRELEEFPEGRYDDQVDASSGAFHLLTSAGAEWEVEGAIL